MLNRPITLTSHQVWYHILDKDATQIRMRAWGSYRMWLRKATYRDMRRVEERLEAMERKTHSENSDNNDEEEESLDE